MKTVTQLLPRPLPANIVYEGVQIENPSYDPTEKCYTARVYGVCRGNVLPLVLSTAVAYRRIEDVVITDAEIDVMLEAKPELAGDRVAAAFSRAFERLYNISNEQPPNPYA